MTAKNADLLRRIRKSAARQEPTHFKFIQNPRKERELCLEQLRLLREIAKQTTRLFGLKRRFALLQSQRSQVGRLQ